MRRPTSRVVAVGIQPYEAHDAINTIARARQHLANPKMVKAIKAHMDGLNETLSGGLRPKKPMAGRGSCSRASFCPCRSRG